MATLRKTITTGLAAVLLLGGLTTGAQGYKGSAAFNQITGIQIRGNVICAGCSLAEVRKERPDNPHLVQLVHRRGQVVLDVRWVSDPTWWHHRTTVPRLWVRGQDSLFEQLTAEKNLLKAAELTGLLRTSRTLDLLAVTVHG